MKNLKNILENKFSQKQIQEKLIITKDSKLSSNIFIFNPKEKDKYETYANKINNIKLSLPFDIIVDDNERITIIKIEWQWDNEISFDVWNLYDKYNKVVTSLTNAGIYKLITLEEEIYVHLYDSTGSNRSTIIADQSTIHIIKESINEKLIINKDSKLKADFEIKFDKHKDNVGRWEYTDNEIDKILDNIKNKFYYDIIPSHITNLKYDSTHKRLEQSYGAIFLFYSDEWRNTPVGELNYIMIYKAKDGSYSIDVHEANKHGFLYESDWYKTLDEIFDDFYKTCKNIKLRK